MNQTYVITVVSHKPPPDNTADGPTLRSCKAFSKLLITQNTERNHELKNMDWTSHVLTIDIKNDNSLNNAPKKRSC